VVSKKDFVPYREVFSGISENLRPDFRDGGPLAVAELMTDCPLCPFSPESARD
jgi:hypothetical protein